MIVVKQRCASHWTLILLLDFPHSRQNHGGEIKQSMTVTPDSRQQTKNYTRLFGRSAQYWENKITTACNLQKERVAALLRKIEMYRKILEKIKRENVPLLHFAKHKIRINMIRLNTQNHDFWKPRGNVSPHIICCIDNKSSPLLSSSLRNIISSVVGEMFCWTRVSREHISSLAA